MLHLPSAAKPFFLSFSVAFTKPTFQRILWLAVGAILAMGQRTVTAVLWTLRGIVWGHHSTYHRVFSRASWSLWPLGRILATAVLRLIPEDEPVLVPMDDTTAQHRGKKVYGKGCHHDAVRSSHKLVVWRWGHRWVVLAISVKLPFTWRRWALPVLAALYRPEELNRSEKRRHKTAPDLARGLMAVLIHWFPKRKFIFLGDGGYASHELARFCVRHSRHATLVSRFHKDANLYDPPPKVKKRKGRPRVKGKKIPMPQEVVAATAPTKATVNWYGGGNRRVELVSGTGQWYKSGRGLVPIRWVFTHDIQGTHRDDYFYTTDPDLSPAQIISWFTARWPIETTFQEVRAHLGFETTRQRVANSVLRMAPCLLGLYSLITLIFVEHARHHSVRPRGTNWYAKTEPTFSDAMATVRRLLWSETIFETPSQKETFQKLPSQLRRILLDRLSLAA
jgi:hypothetical protein